MKKLAYISLSTIVAILSIAPSSFANPRIGIVIDGIFKPTSTGCGAAPTGCQVQTPGSGTEELINLGKGLGAGGLNYLSEKTNERYQLRYETNHELNDGLHLETSDWDEPAYPPAF